ncbi:hypothetical protein ACP70R_019586 [Stipagrostis hirtigluma subsp. patula]
MAAGEMALAAGGGRDCAGQGTGGRLAGMALAARMGDRDGTPHGTTTGWRVLVALGLRLPPVPTPSVRQAAAGLPLQPYNGFQHAANLSLDGSASVLRGGALQLTNDGNNLMGHAFLDSPVQAIRGNAVMSFSTAFVFDIMTVGHGGGHGLAFVVAASKALPGASAEQYLGLLGKSNIGNSSNHIFAVEFDTVQTSWLLNETNGNHVGVDLNSLVSNVSEPAAYFTGDGKNVSVALEGGQPIQAWVDYDGCTNVLNVTIAPVAVASRPHRPLISRAVDLLPIFKQDMYVGFSAATGKLASSHYILAWSFHTGGGAQPIDLSRLPRVPEPPAPPPSISTVIKIVAVSCVATVAVIVAAIVFALWLRRRAILGDFGLARLFEHGVDPATTRIVGTLGYMAPELTVTARITTATDVTCSPSARCSSRPPVGGGPSTPSPARTCSAGSGATPPVATWRAPWTRGSTGDTTRRRRGWCCGWASCAASRGRRRGPACGRCASTWTARRRCRRRPRSSSRTSTPSTSGRWRP